MNETKFYEKLNKVYPPLTKFSSQLIILVPIGFVIYLDLWREIFVQIMILLLIITTIYTIVNVVNKRKKVISLYNEFKFDELIELLLIDKKSKSKGFLSNPLDKLDSVNKIDELIEVIKPTAIEITSEKTVEQQLDDMINAHSKDNKLAIIMWAVFNVFIFAIYFVDARNSGEPVFWEHMIFTVGGINLFSISLFIGLSIVQKKESKLLSQYSNNIDYVIEHYEQKKEEVLSKKVMTKHEKELHKLPIEKVLKLLHEYKSKHSDFQ